MEQDIQTNWASYVQSTPELFAIEAAPVSAPTIRQRNELQEQVLEAKADADVLGAVGAAFQNEWLAFGGERWYDRATADFAPQPDFEIQPERREALRFKYGTDMMQAITEGVRSEDELNFRIQNADEDLERNRRIAQAGWVGPVATVGAAVLDPVGWVASIPTGGAVKVGLVGRAVRGAIAAGVSNAAIESVLVQGDMTRDLDDIMVALGSGMAMGSVIGAVARGRATKLSEQGDDRAASIVRSADAGDRYVRAVADDSIGAMRVKGAEVLTEGAFDISSKGEDLLKTLQREGNAIDMTPRRWAGTLSALGTVVHSSQDASIRGLGARLFESPQGLGMQKASASLMQNTNLNRLKSADMNRFNDGFDLWLKENNINPVAGHTNSHYVQQYNEKVWEAVRIGMDESTPKSIRMAAEGKQAMYREALALRQRSGEAGFEKVKADDKYMPDIFDSMKARRQFDMHDKEDIIELFSRAYQNGARKIPKEVAEEIARAQVNRVADATLTGRMSFEKAMSGQTKAEYEAIMRKAGFSDEEIEKMVEALDNKETRDNISNRAKMSLGLDVTQEYKGIRMRDFMNTNVEELTDNYMKEAAGGAALARQGFSTYQAALNAIDLVERNARNTAKDSKASLALDEEVRQMREGLRLIMGKSIDADPQARSAKMLRRGRDITGVLRLGQMGFAQLGELANFMGEFGVAATTIALGKQFRFTSKALRSGDGFFRDKNLAEVERMVGYIGEDNWLTTKGARPDEFGDVTTVRGMMVHFDQSMNSIRRAQTNLSLFRMAQGSLERMTNRQIALSFIDHLEGKKVIPQKKLEELGLTQEFMTSLQNHYDANSKGSGLLGFDTMPYAMGETLANAIRRKSGLIIQRNFIGDEGIWMNKALGKTFAQLKSFSLVSGEKQFGRGIRHDKIGLAKKTAFGFALGSMVYAAKTYVNSIGRDDQDEYLEEKLSPKGLAFGALGMMSTTAVFSLGGDFLGGLGVLPSELVQSRYEAGFQTKGLIDQIPLVGVGQDAYRLADSITKYAEGDTEGVDVARRVLRLVPLTNVIGVQNALRYGLDELED
ncbi:putative internal virion protein [Escherichia phage vB_EcoP_ACG-C91]|uniref:Putative internal virion protein n=1 Tax=Escherichia phage vB_EcoP_ACG-C91 TaxID=1141139 RepID=K4FE74_9CAUD|nr:putative internal virion protein [Escherichia phage vB_EcoP_ACG-C91]AFH19866.1 putative internal virion protein [Escherichia phage vB_EcoP_ACG-C91]